MNQPAAPRPSRRDFLAASAAAVSAAGLADPRALLQPVAAAKPLGDQEIRIGLIGCGGRGTGAASQALHTAGPVKLVAMGDAFSDRLEGSLKNLSGDANIAGRIAVDEDHRFVGFDAYQKVIDSDLDLVILTTPPHFRPDHFEYAVQKGRHVFMEKPVAVDGYGIRKVLANADVAESKRLCVGVGLQRHHQNGYRETMKRVHDGAIGDIVAARCYWNQGGLWHADREQDWSDMEWQLRNWLYFTWLSGDHICEQHIHNIDVINWAKQGHPVRAYGMGGRQVRTDPRFGQIYDHHAVQFEYADESFLFSECRQIDHCWNSVSEHLVGTKGRADMNTGRWQIRGESAWQFGRDGRNEPYQTEHDDLFAAIRQGEPYVEARYGAESTLTAIMGRMATYTGREITWEEALASERLGPDTYEWGDLPVPPVAMPGQA